MVQGGFLEGQLTFDHEWQGTGGAEGRLRTRDRTRDKTPTPLLWGRLTPHTGDLFLSLHFAHQETVAQRCKDLAKVTQGLAGHE